jgi:hypothetical protein
MAFAAAISWKQAPQSVAGHASRSSRAAGYRTYIEDARGVCISVRRLRKLPAGLSRRSGWRNGGDREMEDRPGSLSARTQIFPVNLEDLAGDGEPSPVPMTLLALLIALKTPNKRSTKSADSTP